jgi:hypothetical protein
LYGGLDEFLKTPPKLPREQRYVIIEFCIMIGATTAAALGGFLGVILAPFRYPSRWLIRSSGMAAGLGALAGGWIGTMAGLHGSGNIEFGHSVLLAIIGGAIAGIAAATVLRMRVT